MVLLTIRRANVRQMTCTVLVSSDFFSLQGKRIFSIASSGLSGERSLSLPKADSSADRYAKRVQRFSKSWAAPLPALKSSGMLIDILELDVQQQLCVSRLHQGFLYFCARSAIGAFSIRSHTLFRWYHCLLSRSLLESGTRQSYYKIWTWFEWSIWPGKSWSHVLLILLSQKKETLL